MNIQNNTSPNFGSGLNQSIKNSIKNADVKRIEDTFKSVGVDTDFKDSKTIAACSFYIADILDEISKRFKLPLDAIPPSINVSEKFKSGSFGGCLSDTGNFFKGDTPSIGRSIFLKKPAFDSPTILSARSGFDHKFGLSSSSHFLSIPFHEWFHNIHFDAIYKKYGYNGDCSVMRAMYPKKHAYGLEMVDRLQDTYILPNDVRYAKNKFGKFSMINESLAEFFAEFMTQITTKSLDENLRVVKNPLENIPRDLPKFFRNFIENTLSI